MEKILGDEGIDKSYILFTKWRCSQRIVLLGRSGVGKSASGNNILDLRVSEQFKSDCGFGSVTTHSEAKTATVAGREVTVIDTPGLSDERHSVTWVRCTDLPA
uniref:AIG1-type G domain-containing protein n=1 Tax=Oncorhynchus mykiss TaxID=8022 RepID=A0A8K9XDM2_ONCMY